MPNEPQELSGVRVFVYSGEGTALRTIQDATDMVGNAIAQSARLVVIPVPSLDPTFFQLRTGLAGEVLQKFANYRLRVAIVGDYARFASQSSALRDFIQESNRGNAVWFLSDMEQLKSRLLVVGSN